MFLLSPSIFQVMALNEVEEASTLVVELSEATSLQEVNHEDCLG